MWLSSFGVFSRWIFSMVPRPFLSTLWDRSTGYFQFFTHKVLHFQILSNSNYGGRFVNFFPNQDSTQQLDKTVFFLFIQVKLNLLSKTRFFYFPSKILVSGNFGQSRQCTLAFHYWIIKPSCVSFSDVNCDTTTARFLSSTPERVRKT